MEVRDEVESSVPDSHLHRVPSGRGPSCTRPQKGPRPVLKELRHDLHLREERGEERTGRGNARFRKGTVEDGVASVPMGVT